MALFTTSSTLTFSARVEAGAKISRANRLHAVTIVFFMMYPPVVLLNKKIILLQEEIPLDETPNSAHQIFPAN
ncbi:hypothetical protein H206_06296 [Candidatus Electrothrix aarhusensis]|uniref:Uncharacterized protein n=1 Tax=Candidatus Electrothrix aarhusensis TaxID=1859131 RepID=A0A3S3QHE0_9BACT|nr:hypothetical protein H206_06296 [Candidatus Electrothrix aarhusensis]